jgi:hypothetical protein
MELERWKHTDGINARCDFNLNDGQRCGNKAAPGVSRCPLHGANKQQAAQENRSKRQYRLAKFQQRVNEFADHDRLKYLNEEIGILRLLLEERLNACEDSHSMILQSGPITDLVVKIEKLVASCHKLESQLGGLLSKAQIKNIAANCMQAVADAVGVFAEEQQLSDEQVGNLLEKVAQGILEHTGEL